MTLPSTSGFEIELAVFAAALETALEDLLDETVRPGEIERPPRLMAAIRHAALAGGKRLRPWLVVETARLFGVDGTGVLRAAAAVEMVHCYSLVHDDLPAMDDDDMRRGRPTVHRAYDEATAILAGDALLTMAFDILADPDTDADPAVRAAMVLALARAAGAGGMVGGQALDLAAEGRYEPDGRPQDLDAEEIGRLQAMKTGALIAVSVEIGALLGRADPAERDRLARYARLLGRAFQIADDLIDVEASAETAGKATGKDAARGKATLVALEGAEAMREVLGGLVAEAEALLEPFGSRAAALSDAALFVAFRSR
ncbi:polyprenyl synthetase family protein [Prosthecomicrobium sp. N25]|uniref:polyprenyl synthetase family protein n=1 Tax=Prosthecomicrobium sp. N25 TaxID=3129254 RepID=UPI0030774094